jgi:hypothetical protein
MTDTREDRQDLPDTPLFALLRSIEARIGTERIDRIWVFPPRRLETGETAVVVVAALLEDDPERRAVYAAHYTAAETGPPRLALDQFGTAPTERVGRVVEDVLERIKDAPAAAPKAARIEGVARQWHELLHALAEEQLEEASRPGRRRRDPRPRPSGRSLRPRGSR